MNSFTKTYQSINLSMDSLSFPFILWTQLLFQTRIDINNPPEWDTDLVYVKPTVSLLNSTTGSLISFADSYIINSSKISFTNQPNVQYLAWYDVNGDPITTIVAARGVYSAQAFLRPSNSSLTFGGVLSISLSSTSLLRLGAYPTTASAGLGDSVLSIFIGAQTATRDGIYTAMFYKESDPYSLYGNIPALRNSFLFLSHAS